LGGVRLLAAPGHRLAAEAVPGQQSQVREDRLDHRLLQDRRIDLQLAPKPPAVCDGNWPVAAKDGCARTDSMGLQSRH
jgi:hypothetical protein